VLLAIAVALALTGVRARGIDHTTLDALLTISADLPAGARRILVQEAESIWRDAGVQIKWVESSQTDASRRVLRVLVDRRPGTPALKGNWVVGELLRFDDGAAVAIASIARAKLVVDAAGAGRSHVSPDAVVQHRLGLVLGRAVAHEIGHYLLNGSGHVRHGLMRASFQPREFTDLRTGTFDLDDASQLRIQARLRSPDRADAPLTLSRSLF
jgi:hypothetical protein